MMGFWDGSGHQLDHMQTASRSGQITTPTPSVIFYRPDEMLFITSNQWCQSTEGQIKTGTNFSDCVSDC